MMHTGGLPMRNLWPARLWRSKEERLVQSAFEADHRLRRADNTEQSYDHVTSLLEELAAEISAEKAEDRNAAQRRGHDTMDRH